MIADTTRDVITMTSNTGKYPPTYGDLFPYVIERGGTSPDGVEMESSGPWPVTNIDTPAGDEATYLLGRNQLISGGDLGVFLGPCFSGTHGRQQAYHRSSRRIFLEGAQVQRDSCPP